MVVMSALAAVAAFVHTAAAVDDAVVAAAGKSCAALPVVVS